MAITVGGTTITFNDGTTQSTAASASSYIGGRGQVFTASGTFTVPTGVTAVKVTVVGGGGGGAGANGGCNPTTGGTGGGGGEGYKWITGLTPGTNISVTVGSGGSGSSWPNNATAGGTTSFGSYCSATGGAGGTIAGGSGVSGSTTGTDLNIIPFPATGSNAYVAGSGGYSRNFGIGGRNNANATGGSGIGYGAGGGGIYGTTYSATGGSGSAGLVIVEW